MKKAINLLFTLLLAFCMFSCGTPTDTPKTETVTIGELLEKENEKNTYIVEGTVTVIDTDSGAVIIADGDDVLYVYGLTLDELKIGDLIKVKGKKDISDLVEAELMTKTSDTFWDCITLKATYKVGEKLELPNEIEGKAITYTFNRPSYFDKDNGYEILIGESYDVTIKVTAKCSELGKEKVFEFKIEKSFEKYLDGIMKYIIGSINKSTRGDIKLVYTYFDDPVTITYTSNRPDIITNEGKYIEHRADEIVILTCKIETLGVEKVFDIEIESLGIYDREKADIVEAWLDEYMKDVKLTEGSKLPTDHDEFSCRIRWIAEDPTVVYDYETIRLPKEEKDIYLKAEITIKSVCDIRTYKVHLAKRDTNITDLERAIDFIKTTSSEAFDEFINLYKGATPVIDKSYLIENPSASKYNYTGGLHPEISQEILNERMYEGYKLENPDNILWVVIHETGSTTAGTDALVHAKLQYNIKTNGGREASWHYTVDDGKIYQSFDDKYACWHASDSSRYAGYGNASGIGIEMCVNADGRYDASMRNDARLVASLLIKHKLTPLNIKQHFDMAPNAKPCPEQMRKNKRWFEFLTLVSREYVSQTLLQGLDVSYDLADSSLTEWKLADIYTSNLNSLEKEEIKVKVGTTEFKVEIHKN